MFGENPVRKQDLSAEDLWVQEIFYTIQGEGPFAGRPAVFIRLAGCNLRCWFCDTDFESSDEHFSVQDLVYEAGGLWPSGTREDPLVVITGGEPFRQNITPLVEALVGHGVDVQIETSGSLALPELLPGVVHIVVSPKTSSIQEAFRGCMDYKYIVRAGELDPEDGLPTQSTQVRGKVNRIARPFLSSATVWLQPMEEQDPAASAANLQAAVESCLKHGYRLCLQVHKIAGVP